MTQKNSRTQPIKEAVRHDVRKKGENQRGPSYVIIWTGLRRIYAAKKGVGENTSVFAAVFNHGAFECSVYVGDIVFVCHY